MKRRRFLERAGAAALAGAVLPRARAARGNAVSAASQPAETPEGGSPPVTLFLCGDVMTGRGIDQILPHPSAPHLFEPYVRSALEYVELAERANGRIPRSADFAYVWGDALAELERVRPAARIVNLETAVTASEAAALDKGIHYRMSPANAPCLIAAALDCCVLANNHVLDWGRAGLAETLATLRSAGLRSAGAGGDAGEAAAPASIALPQRGRLLVFAAATESSGVPRAWAATGERAGVNLLRDLSARSVEAIGQQVRAHKRGGDLAIMSLHWGGNWEYEIGPAQRGFAHGLIDDAGIDVVHGHSSHHVKGAEVYRDRLILYGCGDFLTDYEGIGGYEAYRPDLALMYFPTLEAASGRLLRCAATPTRTRRFRVERAGGADARWLRDTLNREGKPLGTRAELRPDDTLSLIWN